MINAMRISSPADASGDNGDSSVLMTKIFSIMVLAGFAGSVLTLLSKFAS